MSSRWPFSTLVMCDSENVFVTWRWVKSFPEHSAGSSFPSVRSFRSGDRSLPVEGSTRRCLDVHNTHIYMRPVQKQTNKKNKNKIETQQSARRRRSDVEGVVLARREAFAARRARERAAQGVTQALAAEDVTALGGHHQTPALHHLGRNNNNNLSPLQHTTRMRGLARGHSHLRVRVHAHWAADGSWRKPEHTDKRLLSPPAARDQSPTWTLASFFRHMWKGCNSRAVLKWRWSPT